MTNDQASVSGYVVDAFEGVNGHFTSIEVLGTHGHNVMARAKRYGRWYMLKGIAPEFAARAAYRETLVKEFDIMMRLQHPGVVQAMNLEPVEGLGECIVMEWVEGCTLGQWLQNDTTRAQRRQVARQLMDALAHIHARGVVHRDIKPGNIMVTSTGMNVKVIDFGFSDTDAHAVLKQPAGTASYMAPEQVSSSQSDVRNDIYSLGLVLEQMNLGLLYKRPIARCLKPIDRRYPLVGELEAELHRRHRRGRAAAWIAAGVATAALISAVMSMIMRTSLQADPALVDSLRHRLETTATMVRQGKRGQDSLRHRLGTLTDSLAQLNAANAQLRDRQQEHEARQRLVDAAIAEGFRRIDAENARTGIKHHVDTLTHTDYLWMDWNYQSRRGRTEVMTQYMIDIRGRFSTKELAEIEYALSEHCTQFETRVQQALAKKKGWIYYEDRKIPNYGPG